MRWNIGIIWFAIFLAIGFAVLDLIQRRFGGVFFDVFIGMWCLWQLDRIDKWQRRRKK